jgi:hypothetical protein
MNNPIVGDLGKVVKSLRLWIQNVTRTQMYRGSGSPEGVVEAVQDATYVDIDTDNLYYKRDSDISGDISQGWRQIV